MFSTSSLQSLDSYSSYFEQARCHLVLVAFSTPIHYSYDGELSWTSVANDLFQVEFSSTPPQMTDLTFWTEKYLSACLYETQSRDERYLGPIRLYCELHPIRLDISWITFVDSLARSIAPLNVQLSFRSVLVLRGHIKLQFPGKPHQ